ncbi:MAG: FmdB family transcriptional regulator [Actinomycetia bacterium]|nr:FmdB family transcriptional regulator [Actinomycetes bacterium]MCH9701101.1 FmdB family transcriptional regulator [Actinomycetes bacterium]MCH9759500.1 FmdB family transcriptional regulator [Actinomycetes bacterium]
MPTYSYACTDCDNKFDVVQSFADDSMTDCPSCDGRLRKLFGKVGVVFKGSGFYRNDSRESKNPAKSSDSSSSSNGTDSSSAASSDKSSSSDTSTSKSSSSDKSNKPSSGTPSPATTASN